MGFEVGDQRFTVLLTLFLSAQRIHFELHRTNAKRLPHAREHHNDFGINVRARHAERFSAELMELTVAAALRAFMTEHRAAVPKALCGSVKEIVFINSTNHSGGAFRTKRQLIAVHGVGEAVHLLFNDVRYLADAAGKNARIFKNRRTDFLITVGRQHVDAGLLHVLPDGSVLRKHVIHALDAGEFFFSHLLCCCLVCLRLRHRCALPAPDAPSFYG